MDTISTNRMRKITLFLCGGATTALIQLSLMALFLEAMHLPYLIAATIAFCVAIVYNFLFQKYITFKNRSKDFLKQSLTFVINSAINYVLNLAILYIVVEYLHIHPLAGQAIAIILIATYNYFIYQWIFKI